MSPLPRLAGYGRLALIAMLTLGVLVIVQLGLAGARLDLTRNGLYTLSDGSRKVLAALDEPIEIRFYYSDEATAEIPLIRNYATRVRELLEEMATASRGKVRLTVIDPKPFSEDEDRASALGLTAVPLGAAGDGNIFFGLSGSSATGEQASIPFLQPDKEAFLEYDLVKLIYTLAHPRKPVVGLLSSLPMGAALDPATRQIRQPWAVLAGWQELFDVRMLEPATTVAIAPDIGTLIVVHPKRWSDDLVYAIDQFVLRGGHLLLFVDPHAELDPGSGNADDPMAAMLDDRSSDLARLFEHWGVRFNPAQVVLDSQSALSVQSPGGGQVRHPAIVGYGRQQLNQNDVVTANLAVINMASVGSLTQEDAQGPQADGSARAKAKLLPLIQSTRDSMLVDAERLRMQPDPVELLRGFVASKVSHVLAARLQGAFTTAFPERGGEGHLAATKQDASIIVVADTDLLADRLWVQSQDFFQQTVLNAFANNGDFAVNAVDNLTGSTDLIGVRGRAISARPFTRVEALRLRADDRFRQKETELNAELAETERKLNELQGARAADGGIALTPAQNAELERFQTQKLRIRKDLREVRRQLDADIEDLGNRVKFLNIVVVPLTVMLLAWLYATLRRRAVLVAARA